MLFTKPLFSAPLETRPLLAPERMFQLCMDVCGLSLDLVFHQVTTEEARALGGFCFPDQVGFCANLARSILDHGEFFSPKTIAEAQTLQTEQRRVHAWVALEGVFNDLAKKCAASRLKEQVTANRRAMRLVKTIEEKIIDDYDVAKEIGPQETRDAFWRGEHIISLLWPAMVILSRNARTRHDHRTAKRRKTEQKLREAGLPVPPRKRKKRTNVLQGMEARRKLQAAFDAFIASAH